MGFDIFARCSKCAGNLGRSMGTRERYGRKEDEAKDALQAVLRGELDDLRAHAVPDEDDAAAAHLINQGSDRICMATKRERSFCVP